MIKKHRWSPWLVLALACWPAALGAQSAKSVTISGRVSGASGAHTVRVALWQSAHFFETPFRMVSIAPHGTLEFSFAVPPGEWAVSAFEDVNENGICDMGFFGPKEPAGFWRAPTRHGKPTFKDVSMTVSHDLAGVDVHLK